MTSAALHISSPPKFPDLLRSWRRTRKLSQGTLSLNAGVSQRHLSFLESGRSSPSREMVILLASTLSLPLREKNALLNAAGFANMYGHSNIDEGEMKQARHALEVMLNHHEPYPAVVIDRNWNLLMGNEANARIFGKFIDAATVWKDIGGHPPNVMRLTLHPQGLRQYLQNWQDLALYFIESLEIELSLNPYNSQARQLLDEVRSYPGMPTTPLPPESFRPYLEVNVVKGDLALSFFTVISTFGTPQDVTLQELRIETFFAANEATEQYLRG